MIDLISTFHVFCYSICLSSSDIIYFQFLEFPLVFRQFFALISVHFLKPFFVFLKKLFRPFFFLSLFFPLYSLCMLNFWWIVSVIVIILFLKVVHFFSPQVRIFHSAHRLRFSHYPKMNPLIISSNSNNPSNIETNRFLSPILTFIWLKSKTYPQKIPVMTNNTLMRAASFISIYPFRDINSTKLQHFTKTNLHKQSFKNACGWYLFWKQI